MLTGFSRKLPASVVLVCASVVRQAALGQTISWTGAPAGNWSDAGNWSGMIVPNASTASAVIDAAPEQFTSAVLDIDATLERLQIDSGDTLTINGSGGLTFPAAAEIGLEGRLVASAGAFRSFLSYGPSLDVSGAGTLQLNSGTIAGDGTLTFQPGITVEATGTLGGTQVFINNRANLHSGTLSLALGSPSSTVNFRNSGLVRGGSSIDLYGTIDNSAGTFIAGNAQADITLLGATLSGGTLLGPGTFNTGFGARARLRDLTSHAPIDAGSGTIELAGRITNNGLIRNSFGLFAGISLIGDVELAGTGSLFVNGGSLTVPAGQTLSNESTIAGHGTLRGRVINTGTISNGQTGELDIEVGTLTNSGTIAAHTFGSVSIVDSTIDNSEGLILANGREVRIGGSTRVVGGTLRSQNGGTIQLGGLGASSIRTVVLQNVTTHGLLRVASGSVELQGAIANQGTIVSETFNRLFVGGGSTVSLDGGGVLRVSAPNFNQGPAAIGGPGGSVLHNLDHTILFGGRLATSNVALINHGTLAVDTAFPSFGHGVITTPQAVPLVNHGTISLRQNTSMLVVGGLENSGTMLVDGVVAIDYPAGAPSPIDTIEAQIITGYSGGTWTGPGIRSALAAANAGFGIGIGEIADIAAGTTSFDGFPVDDSTVIFRFTLLGDADLDKTVDIDDFGRLASRFNRTGARWSDGDFNYDRTIDMTDFALLAANFNRNTSPLALRPTSIPEPGWSIGLLVAGHRRRRHACR